MKVSLEKVIGVLVIVTLFLHFIDYLQTNHYMSLYGWGYEKNPSIKNIHDLNVAKGKVLLMMVVFLTVTFVLRYFPAPFNSVLRGVLVISLAYPLVHIIFIVLKNFKNIIIMSAINGGL